MNNTVQIIAKSDESEARVAEQKLQLKGYQTQVLETKNVVINATDLPQGQNQFLTDPDDQIFVVIGTK